MIFMEISIKYLKQLAFKVYDAANPLIGQKEASRKYERGAGGDITMYIDRVAEDAIIRSLKKDNINCLLVSEEVGEIFIGDENEARKSQLVLIVDPLDGSNNAVRGIPYSSVSIAYATGTKMNDIIGGIVLNLNTKDLYWAEKGKGAFLNNEQIHVSNLDITKKCFFDLPRKNLMNNLQKLAPIISRFYRIRILGSTALTLCQIASGNMEAFVDLKESNRLLDVAAGFLILKEAGGKIFSLEGAEIDYDLSIDVKFPFIACNVQLESFLKNVLIKKTNESNI